MSDTLQFVVKTREYSTLRATNLNDKLKCIGQLKLHALLGANTRGKRMFYLAHFSYEIGRGD